MRRGEIWTVAGGGDFTSKPRPAVILQNDLIIDALHSITICPFTTHQGHGSSIRIPIEPNEQNGLGSPSRLMVDRITTVRKSRLGVRIGRLDEAEAARLSEAVALFLGLEYYLETVATPR